MGKVVKASPRGMRPGADSSVARTIAARYLAIGTTKQYAAEKADVERQTVYRWLNEPAFLREVERLRAQAMARVEPAILANLHLALEVQRQVLNGELQPSSGRWLVAERLIEQFLAKLLSDAGAGAADVPTAASGAAHPHAAVQVNFGPRPDGGGGPVFELPAG